MKKAENISDNWAGALIKVACDCLYDEANGRTCLEQFNLDHNQK